MAELSKIRKNGVDYDMKDATARSEIEKLKQNSGGNVDQEAIDQAVVKYLTENPVEGGMTQTEKSLILTLFRNAAYTSPNMADTLAQLEELWSGGDVPDEPDEPDEPVGTTYTITAELVNVASSNRASSVTEGASYNTTLTANDGYEISSVTVFMGGVDVTASVYANGVITIPAVTGNVEIVASATESEVKEPELITDGLEFDYDFRNAEMESYNLTVWGNVYRKLDKTGNAMIFGGNAASGDNNGLSGYNFREQRMLASETQKVELGETYTVQALYRATADARVQPNLLNWGRGNNLLGQFVIAPKYLVGTTETAVPENIYNRDDTTYIVMSYIVNGTNLTVYHNSEVVFTADGSEYEGFTKWVDYGVPNVIFNRGYSVAYVGYNRALTQQEIVENIAYFKTLEVA